jgi:microcystin-dependent protein
MAQPYVGEIRMFAGNFAPAGWQLCEGQLLPISENETLFQLIGTTYGGDGQNAFALPDLRGRIPIHQGQGPGLSQRQLALKGGAESVTLTVQQLPAHTHNLVAAQAEAETAKAAGALPARADHDLYKSPVPVLATMHSQAIGGAGGSQSHDNVQPFLCVNFIISLFGIFPSQT